MPANSRALVGLHEWLGRIRQELENVQEIKLRGRQGIALIMSKAQITAQHQPALAGVSPQLAQHCTCESSDIPLLLLRSLSGCLPRHSHLQLATRCLFATPLLAG